MVDQTIPVESECYEADELFCFWSHTPRQPWQDEKYYESQRRIVRPSQFQRIHRNEWVSSESAFISPETFDRCIAVGLRPDLTGSLFIGVDAATKRDCAAIVAVKYEDNSASDR